ncbi:hypothetical protein J5X84_12220 [Streptosporangiaceae bacterium NEAU-GS5]|nr:hypothetical protein [Streptosporangiaceae bacterium NEAU-GS5]
MSPMPDRPTITKAQALERIQELIDGAAAAVVPKPKLELYKPSLRDATCDQPTDGGSKDRIVVHREYYLNGIPKDQLKDASRKIKTYWEQQGHYIDGVAPDGIGIYARSRPEDFYLALSWSEGDVLLLGSTSTCIWPNGTPEGGS